MIRYTEWVQQTKEEDPSLIENQLGQLANKVMGLLHDLPKDEKNKLLEMFIQTIKEQIK